MAVVSWVHALGPMWVERAVVDPTHTLQAEQPAAASLRPSPTWARHPSLPSATRPLQPLPPPLDRAPRPRCLHCSPAGARGACRPPLGSCSSARSGPRPAAAAPEPPRAGGSARKSRRRRAQKPYGIGLGDGHTCEGCSRSRAADDWEGAGPDTSGKGVVLCAARGIHRWAHAGREAKRLPSPRLLPQLPLFTRTFEVCSYCVVARRRLPALPVAATADCCAPAAGPLVVLVQQVHGARGGRGLDAGAALGRNPANGVGSSSSSMSMSSSGRAGR